MNKLEGKKVLIVEDDSLLRRLVCGVFDNVGAVVAEAENGTIAFSMLSENNYDVVLSDIRMPGGDGITLAKNIKKLNRPNLLVFIYSGYNDLTDELIRDLGIIKNFEKPFDIDELLIDIERFLP
ncbi:MAG: response regulator [Bdellovibrionales bacterium]|nr:response regulator [Bdellovibrionales bacterium]